MMTASVRRWRQLLNNMEPISFTIPRHAVQQRFRPPKKNIPQTTVERTHVLQAVRHYVAEFSPVPPIPAEELKLHANKIVEHLGCDPIYRDYVGVLLNRSEEHTSELQ